MGSRHRSRVGAVDGAVDFARRRRPDRLAKEKNFRGGGGGGIFGNDAGVLGDDIGALRGGGFCGGGCAGVFVVGGARHSLGAGRAGRGGGYVFAFHGASREPGPNYTAEVGEFTVMKGGEIAARLRPEKRFYPTTDQAMTEAAIDAGLFRDLYVSLGEPLGDGAWSARLQVKPFVRWIWAGAALMAFGRAFGGVRPPLSEAESGRDGGLRRGKKIGGKVGKPGAEAL